MAMLLRRCRALAGRPGMAMVEVLGMTGGIVNLALGIVPPINYIGNETGCTRATRLANNRAAARGERLAAFAQRRGRLGLALPPIHDPPPPIA